VSGLAFHPTEQNLLYARTDVGGAYRWSEATGRWIPLNDAISRADAQLHGVLSLALDRNDPNRVYLAAGQYTASWARTAALMSSADRGATWSSVDLPFKLGGNEDGRTTGERLQVDPNKGSILLLGATANGLWRSDNRGAAWSQIAAFTPTSVTFVLFDPRSGSTGNATQTIFVGVNSTTAATIYRSNDGGATWASVPNQPIGFIPHRADIDANGVLYISYSNSLGPVNATNGAVWKFNTGTNIWTPISPVTPLAAGSWDQFGYAGLSIDPQQPGTVMVATLNRYAAGENIFRTTDGGLTWKALRAKAQTTANNAPWAYFHRSSLSISHWMGALTIDPKNSNRVWYGSGVGVWRSSDVIRADADLSTTWTFPSDGIEESVLFELKSPPSGAPLLSAMWDIDGFRHDTLDASPASGMYNPANGHGPGLDFAESNPNLVVRTSIGAATRGYRSADGGSTWTAFGSAASGALTNNPGKIAISAQGSYLVWMPENSPASYSIDNGATWSPSAGSPGAGQNLTPVADRVDDKRFAIYDQAAGRVYVSTDGGASFAAGGVTDRWGGVLRAAPGFAGHLWLPTYLGIQRSTNGGVSFSYLPGIQEAWSLGFGKAAPGQTHPAVYVWGKVNNVEGIYRSDNVGVTWVRINDDAHRFGYAGVVIGDPRVYGRVYIGTGGRGIIIGDLN
jgi:hypothetical protein